MINGSGERIIGAGERLERNMCSLHDKMERLKNVIKSNPARIRKVIEYNGHGNPKVVTKIVGDGC